MSSDNHTTPKKRVLYVITKSNWGGAQRYVYDLSASLPKEEFEVSVACGGEGLLVEYLREASIKTITIPFFQRDINFFKEIAAFFQLLKIYKQERPDIIHLNSSKAGVIGSVAALWYGLTTKNRKPKTVFTVHGWAFREDRFWLSNLVIFLSNWISSFFQDAIIVINSADMTLARKFINSQKIFFIPNGIRIKNFYDRKDARKILGEKIGKIIQDKDFVMGCVAELTRNKGLLYFIKALELISRSNRNFKAVIIGEGEERPALEKIVKKYKLEENIILPGFVPSAARLMSSFDAFALPSLKEGLPYVLMEAMSAGLPIIACNVGGIPDLIEDGVTGMLVPCRQPKILAQGIKKLMNNEGLGVEFGNKSVKKIAEKFTLDGMVSKTTELYKI